MDIIKLYSVDSEVFRFLKIKKYKSEPGQTDRTPEPIEFIRYYIRFVCMVMDLW